MYSRKPSTNSENTVKIPFLWNHSQYHNLYQSAFNPKSRTNGRFYCVCVYYIHEFIHNELGCYVELAQVVPWGRHCLQDDIGAGQVGRKGRPCAGWLAHSMLLKHQKKEMLVKGYSCGWISLESWCAAWWRQLILYQILAICWESRFPELSPPPNTR